MRYGMILLRFLLKNNAVVALVGFAGRFVLSFVPSLRWIMVLVAFFFGFCVICVASVFPPVHVGPLFGWLFVAMFSRCLELVKGTPVTELEKSRYSVLFCRMILDSLPMMVILRDRKGETQ